MNKFNVPVQDEDVGVIPFTFSEALFHLKAGLRVADISWGTGEWLSVETGCASLTAPFIKKYNQGILSAWSPDSLALWAEYIVLK